MYANRITYTYSNSLSKLIRYEGAFPYSVDLIAQHCFEMIEH